MGFLSISGPHRACVVPDGFVAVLLTAPEWRRWYSGADDVHRRTPFVDVAQMAFLIVTQNREKTLKNRGKSP